MELMKTVRLIKGNKEDSQTPVDPARWRRRAGFSFPVFRPLGVACALRFSLGCALALLILSVPNASAQPFASRDLDKEFETSGYGLPNKNPSGVWMDEDRKVMLVMDHKSERIYSYSVNPDPENPKRLTLTRLDDHHNEGPNTDDFLLEIPTEQVEEKHIENGNTVTNIVTKQSLRPYGIWANGTTNVTKSTLWVSYFRTLPGGNGEIRAYTLTWTNSTKKLPGGAWNKYATGTRIATKDVTVVPGTRKPHGIWANDEFMYVADNGKWRIYAYAYNSASGKYERTADSEKKDLWRDGTDPNYHEADLTGIQGVWSDGTTIWVSSIAGDSPGDRQKIYAYNVETTLRYPAKDFNNLSDVGNDKPRGIWSDGETMWVVDQTDNKFYAYHAFLSPTTRNDKQDFDTLRAAENNTPKGIWSDGQTLWVADGDDDKLYAYNLATKARDSDKEIGLAESLTDLQNEDNSDPSGIWSDRTTIWVADDVDDKLYAYNLATKARDSDKEIDLDSNNSKPSGLWANETTIWVADSVFTTTSTVDGKSITRKKLFAYKRELGEGETERRLPDKEIDLDPANSNPSDIWSDKTTIWVADTVSDKLYAYDLANGDRVSSKDFDTLDSENTTPTGLWSDGATMWVVDDHPNTKRDKIYAYRLSNAASLGALELTGHVPSKEYEDFEEIQLRPSFDSGTTRYTASVPYATESLTVEAKALRSVDNGGISYADATTTNTHQINLGVGNNPISITVTNRQATGLPRTRTYTVDVTREFFTYNDPSKDVALSTSWMPTNVVVRGLWTDGTTMWLSARESTQNQNGEDPDHFGKLYSYNLQSSNVVVSTNTLTHNNPYGIWANKTTMWVADYAATFTKQKDGETITYKKILAYKMSDRTRESTKDFDLDPSNSNPQWIWSDGETMWVSDNATITNIVNGKTNTYQKIYAYEVSGRDRWADKDILLEKGKLHTNNDFEDFAGIWSDGATLWIADKEDAKIYAYKLKTDESPRTILCPDATEDFNTLAAVDNTDPKGIYSDGSTMWVVDNTAKKIFAYNQPLSANNKLKRLALSDNDGDDNVYYGDLPFSLHFSNNETNYTNGVYVLYPTTSATVDAIAQDPDAGVEIQPKDADANTDGHQVNLADGDNPIIITVTAENAAVKEYIVNVSQRSGERTPIKDFNNDDFSMMNSNPTGLWGNATSTNIARNLWVADEGQDKIYAYDLASKTEIAANGFNTLAAENTSPWGIWANDTTMWVTDYDDNKIYAYNMEGSKEQVTGREIQLKNTSLSTGLWSNGATMWVASETFKEIYAYNMWTNNPQGNPVWDGSLDATKDFDHTKLDNVANNIRNQNPLGIWSNGTTMWVANGDPDRDDNVKIYAYNLKTKARDAAKDINNLKSQLGLGSRTEFKGGIWSDGVTMWASVVHADTRGKNLYAFNLPQPTARTRSGPSEDSALKDLRLSGVTLTPDFSPDQTEYTAMVEHDVASTTVTAAPNNGEAGVEIFWASHETASRRTAHRGAQVSLEEGYNLIAVYVTAENGSGETYFVEVTKAEAPPTSGGPLPVFQTASASSSSFAAGIGEWKSQFIFAEPLLNGGVRFVFLVPPEELKIEETADLLGETWKPLPEEEAQILRESNDNGQDRLTIILPNAAGKQRFLRLMPQR